MHSLRVVAFFAWCAAVSAAQRFDFAQEAVNYGSVSGRVTDPQGAVVAGAQVTARQTGTNLIVAKRHRRGRALPVSVPEARTVRVVVRREGFADATRRLTVSLGSASIFPSPSRSESVDTSVTVTGETTVLEAAQPDRRHRLDREVNALPAQRTQLPRSRAPRAGCLAHQRRQHAALSPRRRPCRVRPSIGSQRNFSNNFIVDGLSANDDAAGLSGMPYGVDAVEQFQVVTSGGQAELGRALGGYVNVVTKSGTNRLRGDVYGYFRDDSLNARERRIAGKKLPMTQKQYGGSLGGPIVRDRTFFFANVEQRLLDQSGLATILRENVPVINARLAAVGYPGSPIATGVYPNPVHSVQRAGEVDHQFSGNDQFSVRYSLYDVDVQQLARRRRAQRAERVVRSRQPRSGARVQQHADAVAADGQRNARAVRLRRPEGAAHAIRSVRR